ncbi:hypothetical protein CTheo_9157 [Ceratobasidium theobromae]|uniref:Uncharacterized protein n=1 Tax=Ceratobasidium theobromae TaxID=1582974 RepID=A0A5N5Q670_9AGAM|nr:hypothetical protein CTheo_9157 [Ceratobasidium theobromae]
MGQPVLASSEDWLSEDEEPDVGDEAMMADDEESVSSEEPDTPAFDAFQWANEPVHEWSVAANLGPEWVVNDTYKLAPLPSQDPSAEVSDFELNAELAGEPPAAAEPASGTWGSEIDPTFFGSSPTEWATLVLETGQATKSSRTPPLLQTLGTLPLMALLDGLMRLSATPASSKMPSIVLRSSQSPS